MKTAILVGGGLDSWAVTLSCGALQADLFFVDYGQSTSKLELEACQSLATMANKPLIVATVDSLHKVNQNSLLLDKGTDPIVLLRNLEFIHLAAKHGYDDIVLCLLNERGVMFPDADAEFVRLADAMYHKAYNIRVRAPYIDSDKWDFVCHVNQRIAFFDIAHTCYHPIRGGCGTCLHCDKLISIREYSRSKYDHASV